MSLVERLRTIGTKLGLMQIQPAVVAGEPAKVITRAVSLDELRTGIRREQVAALAKPAGDTPVDLGIPFPAIDEAAGVKRPAHGWTADQLIARLQRADVAALPREQQQSTILAELEAAGAPVDDVARDAMARDQAVDAFAAAAHAVLAAQAADRARRRTQLVDTIAALQRELSGLDASERTDQDRWRAWWATKLARERDLAQALGLLLDRPLISVDEQAPPLL